VNVVDKATEAQLKNIQTRTGKTLDELFAFIRATGLAKHGEIREALKRDLGMGHGDANALAGAYLKSDGEGVAQAAEAAPGDVAATLYTGPKADLLSIHEKLMAAIADLGPFETAPKKGYLSLRRKKQFATVGPATRTRVELGLNMKGVPATKRLVRLPAGRMCQYKVDLTDVEGVDGELMAWVARAYDGAG
jgi:hypothetical protein